MNVYKKARCRRTQALFRVLVGFEDGTKSISRQYHLSGLAHPREREEKRKRIHQKEMKEIANSRGNSARNTMCFGMYRRCNTDLTHFESQSGYPFDLDIQKSKRAVWGTRGEFRCCNQRFPSFEANSSQIQSRD